MKRIIELIAFMAVYLIVLSCNKSSSGLISPASVNIVNAIATSKPLIPIFGTNGSIRYFASAQTVGYGSSFLYSPLSGPNSLYIVQNSGVDTLLTDPKLLMFNGTLNLTASAIYSFFLAGDTTKPDTVFTQDNVPPYYSDSSAGARFINLSPNSQPLSVNIEGNSNGSEVSSLPYKSISSFKKYAATSSIVGKHYLFVIRDQAGDSLTSYPWSYTLFKNNTLVIAGYEDSTGSKALKVFPVNNF